MDQLTARRQQFVEEHQKNIDKMQLEIMDRMTKAMVDRKSQGSGGFSFLNTLKAQFGMSRESSLGMNSHDKLEYSKLFFGYLNENLRSVRTDPGYRAVLKDIDEQMALYKKEIDLINEELKSMKDDSQKKGRQREKDDLLKKAA
jgi:hypothetical protein